MELTDPAGLWLAALALPILALHVLRPRRDPLTVSSTWLWDQVPRPVSSARPWQRLRPSLLLLLQLLAVLLFALAMAGPAVAGDEALAEHTVVIVDASGSMAARDGSPDRITEAKREAEGLLADLPEGGRVSVVVASPAPQVLVSASTDVDEALDAIDEITTSSGAADWASTFTLAESLDLPGVDVGYLLLSDGGLTDAEQRLIPAGSRYEQVGSDDENRALSHLDVEATGSGLTVRASVRNHGGTAVTQTVRIDVDGVTASEQPVRLAPGEPVAIEESVPAGDRIDVYLEGDDLLDADDHVRAVAPRRPDIDVLVVGEESPFLTSLFASLTGVRATHVVEMPAEVPAETDVIVFNEAAVPATVTRPYLAIAPAGGSPAVTVTGSLDLPAVTFVRNDDPLLSGVDLSDVAIAAAQELSAPTADVLAAAEGGPLLLRGSDGGLPFAYLGFALDESNLPLQVAFPILGDRLVAQLSGADLVGTGIAVGEVLPIERGSTTIVTDPAERSREVLPGSPAPTADRAGFWTITVAPDTEVERTTVIAVNPPASESAIAPAEALPTPEPTRPFGEEVEPRHVLEDIRHWFLFGLLAVVALELLVARRSVGVPRRQWAAAVVLRAVVVALIAAALIQPDLNRDANRVATIFLIDASASLGTTGESDAIDWVVEAVDAQPSGSLAGVALFGGDARLEATVREELSFDGHPAVRIDDARTDLATALRLGAAALPADARRRVVLLSDGRPTSGDVLTEAERLREAGVVVDTVTVGRGGELDAAVDSLDVPALARLGEEVVVEASISSTDEVAAVVSLIRDGEVVDEEVLQLAVGATAVELTDVADSEGVLRYQVRVDTAGDTQAENDVGFAAVPVEGPGVVLLVEGEEGAADALGAALTAGGLQVREVTPADVPAIDELSTYDSTVLVDVDLAQLSEGQVADLTAVTRDLGRGLVTVGGERSYGLGGYLDSDLEELLPVISDILDPRRRTPVAQVLSIDTSGSMGACHCNDGANGVIGGNGGIGMDEGGVNKTSIARTAAVETIEAMSEGDEVGVLSWDGNDEWVLDLQPIPSDDQVEDALADLSPNGGTDPRLALTAAAEALRSSDKPQRHIIVFTDGFSDPSALHAMAEEAGELFAEGITVSVVGTGEGSDTAALREVAEAGGGRFYPGEDLQEIPRILVRETTIVSRNLVNEGELYPEISSVSPVVSELSSSPPLLGFLGTTEKPEASVLLRIGPDHDPLLATWQAGLGRVTSWTSDATGRWAAPWLDWDGFVDLWTRIVKDTLPTSTGTAAVRAEVDGDVLRVTVESEEAWPEGTTAEAHVADPADGSTTVALERISATELSAELTADDSGTYAIGALVESNGTTQVLTGLATRSYSAEFDPGAPDEALLAEIAELTGGQVQPPTSAAFDPDGLNPGRHRVDLAPWLLLAAALLWPIAAAVHRLTVRSAGRSAPSRLATARGQVASKLPSLPGRERRATTSAAPPSAGQQSGGPGGSGAPPPLPPQVGAGSSLDDAPAPPPPPKEEAEPTTIDVLLARKRDRRPPAG